ncbi:MAG: lipopolysaccharide transport periplasmic protein LptA [Burkholderiales bacterium]|nr:lipopolysaccharide transport periplasmic protein LptA [Burkholderiales bacterium]
MMPFKLLAVATAAFLIGAPAHVHAQAQPQKKQVASPGFGTASKEPIQIDADRLEVFSKEQRAIYSGNVIAVQGDTTIKSAQMIVFYDRQSSPGGQPAAQPAAAGDGEGGTALRRVEAKGGVTVISKDQVATGNEGVFDRSSNKIVLTGNVALSQGENVTKGEKLIYDTETGIAIVESGATAAGGRVRGVFVPGEDKGGVTAKPAAKPAPAPAADPRAKPKS